MVKFDKDGRLRIYVEGVEVGNVTGSPVSLSVFVVGRGLGV